MIQGPFNNIKVKRPLADSGFLQGPFERAAEDGVITEDEFLEVCPQSRWGMSWVSGVEKFIGKEISQKRRDEIAKDNCRKMAKKIDFPATPEEILIRLGKDTK